MLNKYLDRLDQLITEYQKQELHQFRGPDGKAAHWSDLIWYHTNPNTGRKVRFLCGKFGAKGRANAGNRPEYTLRHPYDQLIKIWIIEVNNKPNSADAKQRFVATARRLVSDMQGELYSQTSEGLTEFADHRRIRAENLNPFLEFCSKNGLMPPILILKAKDNRDRTGHTQFDARVDKLPNIEAIIALGAIHHKIFQPVRKSGSVSKGAQIVMMDAVASAFGLLGLASPNRIAAEVPVIPNQQLKKYSESGKSPVHYLDWPGSKGFTDNRNHILAALASEVDRTINFFFLSCEPARALCRFYENPRQSLKTLLGDFKVSSARRKHLELDRAPNLFVLGYALGFYGVNSSVPVAPPERDIHPGGPHHIGFRSSFTEKPIHALTREDRLSTTLRPDAKLVSILQLIGYESLSAKAARELGCTDKILITIGELQDHWIRYFTTTLLPAFPYSYTQGEGKIRLASALFCLLGPQFYGTSGCGSGGKTLARTYYNVVPLHAIASNVITKLTGSGHHESMFDRYGFSGFTVNQHSLRHFGNTLAELSEIPREITTAWSGRKDTEQTETYLHRSHGVHADRVRAVMGNPKHDRQEIRVVARDTIAQETNLPASVTSSGICTQELNLSPCENLNDFVSQCFMCSSACHIAGDLKAIKFLEKDHEVQVARLDQLTTDQRLKHSIAMQRWFVIHSRNTYILASLIDSMKTLPPGSVIRYSAEPSELHITDMNTKKTIKDQCLIPDFEEQLRDLLLDQPDDTGSNTNPDLDALLSSFGLSVEER